jgi:hypothetical protein
MQRRAFLRAGFGQDQAAIREIERSQTAGPRNFGSASTPVEASGDHQMQDQPQVVIETYRDSFANPAELSDSFAFDADEGWIDAS